jgi:hypothetical protein
LPIWRVLLTGERCDRPYDAKKADGTFTADRTPRHRIRYFIESPAIGDAMFVIRIFVLKGAIFEEKLKFGSKKVGAE